VPENRTLIFASPPTEDFDLLYLSSSAGQLPRGGEKISLYAEEEEGSRITKRRKNSD